MTKKKRDFRIERTVDFRKYNRLTDEDPAKVADIWLRSPIPLAQRAREELQMIYGLKKNALVGKFETIDLVPAGTEAVTGPEDMKGKSVKNLQSLYKKLTGAEKVFETLDQATAEVWGALEAHQEPEKAPKAEKTPREKVVRAAAPSIDSKRSQFTALDSARMKESGNRFAIFQFLQANPASTIQAIAAGVNREAAKVASDLRSMVIDCKATCFTPAPEPAKEADTPATTPAA
jgi:hypothetical protein